MIFKDAFKQMKRGYKIKLPEWIGFWFWDDNSIKMCLNGDIIFDIRQMQDTEMILNFLFRTDWILLK